MRVLQLIDSLRPGGAEKMSVTYANALAKRIDGSFLCCTRKEGLLKSEMSPEVGYLFLDKKNTLDIEAFWNLRRYVKKEGIDIIQAHSSSWFLALLVKLSLPQIVLVWHDHYGRKLKERKAASLKAASRFFDGIISVNLDLEFWARKYLNAKEVIFIRNFLSEDRGIDHNNKYVLLGDEEALKVICLANFRAQKNHINLLEAFLKVRENSRKITLHLVGKVEQNDYTKRIDQFIETNALQDEVFLYGAQQNVDSMLRGADIGVLSSDSEGLPVALLEYGFAGLPVVCTQVGQCEEIVSGSGEIVEPGNSSALAEGIIGYIREEEKRRRDAVAFRKKVVREYSENEVIPGAVNFFHNLIRNKA